MNVNSKTIFTGDNLPIMRGMNSECIDLIYLDPPFNSNVNYAAPIGSEAAGAAFKDTWTLSDVDITWLDLIEVKHPALNRVIHAVMTNSDKSYLIYMTVRLLEMQRILKPTGSIYLHCDPTMSHYLKLVMEAIFGKQNFRNEVVWCYKSGGATSRYFAKKHDIVLFYGKNNTYIFNQVKEKSYQGIGYNTGNKNVHLYEDEHVDNLGPHALVNLKDWWEIGMLATSSKERTGYPTQKPLTLLDRIIKASSNKGAIVFDPFCGCATTLVAADRLQRDWVGVDISPKAAELVVERIKADQGLFQDIIHRRDVPKRTDLGDIPRYNAPENKTQIYGEQGGHCSGCGEHFQTQHLEIDHIIAESVGGTSHIENLQLLCGHCNRIKGDRGQEYLLSRLNS